MHAPYANRGMPAACVRQLRQNYGYGPSANRYAPAFILLGHDPRCGQASASMAQRRRRPLMHETRIPHAHEASMTRTKRELWITFFSPLNCHKARAQGDSPTPLHGQPYRPWPRVPDTARGLPIFGDEVGGSLQFRGEARGVTKPTGGDAFTEAVPRKEPTASLVPPRDLSFTLAPPRTAGLSFAKRWISGSVRATRLARRAFQPAIPYRSPRPLASTNDHSPRAPTPGRQRRRF